MCGCRNVWGRVLLPVPSSAARRRFPLPTSTSRSEAASTHVATAASTVQRSRASPHLPRNRPRDAGPPTQQESYNKTMPRIAIPLPHSSDREYAERAIPQYEQAVTQAGGDPIRIPLDQPQTEIKKLIATCDAVLLPGSKADVDPAKFQAPRSPHTAPADVPRNMVDELLLEDAYRHRKPILGICYGLQSLNVFRSGSLIQHIPDFLPEELRTRVDHEAGKKVAIAHTVKIETNSKLAEILRRDTAASMCRKPPQPTWRQPPRLSSEAKRAPILPDRRPLEPFHHFPRPPTQTR